MQLEAELLERQQDKEREHEIYMYAGNDAIIYAASDAANDWHKLCTFIAFIPPSTHYIKICK